MEKPKCILEDTRKGKLYVGCWNSSLLVYTIEQGCIFKMYKKVTVMSDVRTLLPIKIMQVDPEQTRSGTDWGGELQYFMLIG